MDTQTPHAPSPAGPVERALEWALWQSRWLMLVPVLGLLASVAWFALHAVLHVIEAFRTEDTTEAMILHIEAMDASLLAAASVIFALGLYELFISKINVVDSEQARGVLVISSLDDLKSKLGKIILMLLVVRFFKLVQSFVPQSATDVLAFAGGVVAMAVTLYLLKGRNE